MNQPISSENEHAILTQHAMLIANGLYAHEIGLVKRIESVKLKQKSRTHTPQRKIIEFFVAMLAGCAHLKEISHAAHPLARDIAVAQAWGQSAWADYSGVSRTLQTLSEYEVAQLCQVFDAVEQPQLEQEVRLALQKDNKLVWDIDLTGRSVSSTSTTYPDTAFGYMGDTIALGYQAALVSMHSPTFGRLWLSNQLHPGDTVSVTQLKGMVRAAEQRLGVHPQRRTDLLHERLLKLNQRQAILVQQVHDSDRKVTNVAEKLADCQQQLVAWEQLVQVSEAQYATNQRQPTAHCKLSRRRRKVATYRKRLPRLQKIVAVAQRSQQRQQQKMLSNEQQLQQVQAHLQQLAQDNCHNPNPIRILLRIDGGFSSRGNIAWLIEMGYDIYTKSKHLPTRKQLLAKVDGNYFQQVGRNAEMMAWSAYDAAGHHTYPLDAGLLRYTLTDRYKYAVLLHYGERAVTNDVDEWFHTYNARQTIEAGIKEGKGVFQMHHLKVRSRFALLLQERLACFAANFIRFSAHWLVEQQPEPIPLATHSVKHLVQVVAHTSAWVIHQGDDWLLKFTEHSLYAGHTLYFNKKPIQLPLPFEATGFQFLHF